ncbi:MAG: pyridine nucleotide-disulfide oxidoreductase [Zetaproteobacteria bacterium]|nr:pyridine nucleotide-disulfide oxidoreductase [Pseudobdellovibrionaceae bacterium]
MKSFSRLIVFVIVLGMIGAFVFFDLGQYLNLASLKEQKERLLEFYENEPAQAISIYFIVYIVSVALSLPGAAILTLAGGAIFGFVTGTIIVSFASTIGATLALLVARFLMRESVQSKFGDRLKVINDGIEKEGAYYLFTLRLIPLVPFFVVNLVMGLTPISAVKFFFVSQIGMLGGTLVYVNAGTQLSQLDSLSGIFSPNIILSFAALGILPLASKWVVESIKKKKIYRPWQKPDHFQYNVLVIGAGAAGLVTSLIAATIKAKVGLIEKDKMGGDCLNTGCVPSKALIQSAKLVALSRRATEFGFKSMNIDFEFSDLMKRVSNVIKAIEPNDSVERYTSLGVDCISGHATIKSPWEIEVGGKVYTTKNIVLAAGARPLVPPFNGLDKIDYLTSDNVWKLTAQPETLLVLGGGPIGCEMAQAFQRLGTQVIQVEMLPKILMREDDDVSDMIIHKLKSEGVDIRANHKAKEFGKDGEQKYLICENNGHDVKIEFDQVLIAIGREARVTGYGIEDIGIELTDRKTIQVNDFLQTNYPNIYVAGDVTGPYQFTHVAAHQAWFASVNALFSPFKKFRVDYRVIPWVTFTDPEIGRVGLSEKDAKAKNIAYEVTTWNIGELDRALADQEAFGSIKVLTSPGSDKILGATIVSAHAGELLTEFVAAMKNNYGLNKILGTIHAYPTWSEANKYVAGQWKKARKPEKLLSWVERYHDWRRS